MAINKNNITKDSRQAVSDARVKYFLHLLDVKRDMNMTRIYSAIKGSEFLKPKNQNK